MKLIFNCLLVSLVLGLSGCGTVVHERARFEGNRVSNPTLGRGMYYEVPAQYTLLNPRSPVPPKPENRDFEGYLRSIAAYNDENLDHSAFRQSLLFRAENRYLLITTSSLNLRASFRGMHPGRRAVLLPKIAAAMFRQFDARSEDFNYSIDDRAGRSAITYAPFEPATAGAHATGWRATGCTLLGDMTDVADIFIFARVEDLDAARADLDALLARFSYGKPLP